MISVGVWISGDSDPNCPMPCPGQKNIIKSGFNIYLALQYYLMLDHRNNSSDIA